MALKYDVQDYFEETEDPSVNGFAIIDRNVKSGKYHIAEKWLRGDGGKWLQYWIDSDELRSRVRAGECDKAAELSKEQHRKVCERIDHSCVKPKMVTSNGA